MTGCSAGNVLHIKFGRDNTDTSTATVKVLNVHSRFGGRCEKADPHSLSSAGVCCAGIRNKRRPNPSRYGWYFRSCDGGTTFCWSNPSNITANDGTFATVLLATGGASNELQGTNFGFPLQPDLLSTASRLRFSKKRSPELELLLMWT